MCQIDRNDNQITFSPTGITSSAGPQVLLLRDVQGRIREVVDPAGNSIRYDYDENGDLIRVTDRTGGETEFVYNHRHDLMDILDPRGISVARNVYDDAGHLVTVIDAEGNRTEFCRPDRENPPAGCVSPDTLGLPPDLDCSNYEGILDPLGESTIHCYEANGSVSATIYVASDGTVSAINQKTYDALDRVENATDPAGRQISITYLSNTNLPASETIVEAGGGEPKTTSYTYDPVGNILSRTDPEMNTTIMTYDEAGNLISRLDPEGRLSTHTYDSLGNLLATTDPDSNTTTFSYNDQGLLSSETDANGVVTSFTYGPNGNKLSESQSRTLPDGSSQLIVSYTEYDASGRIVRSIDPLSNLTQITYDALGKPSAITNPRGFTTTFEYDLCGNLVRRVYPDGSTEEFTYDQKNRLLTAKDRDDRVTRNEYDSSGNLVKDYAATLNPSDWSDAPFTDIEFNVDETPHLVFAPRTESESQRVITQYQGVPGQHTVIDYLGGLQGLSYSTVSDFDKNSRLIRVTDARGNATERQYDGTGQLVTVVHPPTAIQGVTVSSIAYDEAGRRARDTDQAGKSTEYEYDNLGRLIRVINALGHSTSYAYDEVGNQIAQTDSEGRTTTME